MTAFAPALYILNLLTSATCAFFLVRGFIRSQTKLLLWSAACFVLLGVNNLLVVVDLLLTPSLDLSLLRNLTSLAAVTTLLYGFIWELD